VLSLHPDARRVLERRVRRGYPRETCGLLIGRRGPAAGHVAVERVVEARNLAGDRARERYELDPGDLVDADRVARAAGLEVVGVWHSHPDHPARPSEADRAGAWEGFAYLIASVRAGGVDELRSWRLAGGRFVEQRIAGAAGATREQAP